MNYIFFTFLYILGPEISTARKYLIIDLDALQQLELSSHGARRQSENSINIQQPKDFIKSVINTLQSYDEDHLVGAFNSFKHILANLNIDDETFKEAKEIALNELSQAKGTQIRDILNEVSQMLDAGIYDDQLNNAFNHYINQNFNIDEATLNIAKQIALSKLSQLKDKPGGLNIMGLLSQTQDDNSYHDFIPSMRARDDVRRLLDRFTLRKSRVQPKLNILHTIKSALRSAVDFLFKLKEPSRSNDDDFTPEEKELISKLAGKLLASEGHKDQTDWKTDIYGKLVSKLQDPEKGGDKIDWKKDVFGKLTSKLSEQVGDKTDWNSLLTDFIKDAAGTDSLSWLTNILKKLASNEKAWDMLNKYAQGIKQSGRGYGVHPSV